MKANEEEKMLALAQKAKASVSVKKRDAGSWLRLITHFIVATFEVAH